MIIYSHSKLDIARQCLKKYYYKYVLKLKVVEDDQHAQFGNLIHTILEQYKGTGKKELQELYTQARPKYCFDNEVFKPRIKLALKNIHSFWYHNLRGAVFEPEQEISAPINDDFGLMGKIDLIIFDGKNHVRVIDYKTNKSQKYANHTNQLAMYMYLVNQKYGIPFENIHPEIVYMSLLNEEKSGELVLNEGYENIHKKYNVDDSDVAVLLEEVDAIHHRICRAEKHNKWPGKQSWFNCNFCPFYNECPDKLEIESECSQPPKGSGLLK